MQREVISPALLQLRFIEKWDGVLPRLTAGDSGILPMLTIPAEDLAEDLQEAHAAPASAPTATPEPTPAPEPTSPPVPEAES